EENETHPLNDWLHNPGKYLTTLLVGTNVANIAASLIAGDFFRRLVVHFWGDEHGASSLPEVAAFFSMTFLVLVFGEIMPKIYCRHNHERLAPTMVVRLAGLYRIMRIPIRILMFISNLFIRLLGGEPSEEVSYVTADDLKVLIEVGQKQGLLEEGETEMLHSIFELSETPVREVMTPRVDMIYVNVRDSLHEVLAVFEEHDFSRLPVIEDNRDNVIGILYMKDLIHRWRDEDANGNIVRDLMRPALFVPESKRIDDILEQFRREKTHIAIVVDEYGGTEGLVTIEDVLEEIVGDIEDEFDQDKHLMEEISPGLWEVDAAIDAEDLEDEIGIVFPEDVDFESLAGFLIERHGDLPKTGEEIAHEHYLFTILDADERRISKVRIERKPVEEAHVEETVKEESPPSLP
ncbi:MAG: HlyC/CorC family transporter, partial [Candidatus Omnitrophica bacterium]|nr:HlyC/CorC family transporter [Candidatus Omnitrophota bacterium]